MEATLKRDLHNDSDGNTATLTTNIVFPSYEAAAIATTTMLQKGDRVIVSNIPITTINSKKDDTGRRRRHGHIVAIGSQYCGIHLDSGNGAGNFQTVLVPPNKVQRENSYNDNNNNGNDNHELTHSTIIPLSCTIQNRAIVQNGTLMNGQPIHDGIGCLRTYNAAAMIGMMHLIRWITASSSSLSSNQYKNLSFEQIQQLPANDCYVLNEMAIQNWFCINSTNVDNNDKSTEDTNGIYHRCIQYMEHQQIHSSFLVDALQDKRSMKSWHGGIQTYFWFVGRDDTGSYIVPDCKSHEHVVYKVVGLGTTTGIPLPATPNQAINGTSNTQQQQQQQAPVRMIRIPMRLRVTMLPWYGRLLHDTSIPLPKQQQQQQQKPNEYVIAATDAIKIRRLHSLVLHAIQTGTVIEHFAELE